MKKCIHKNIFTLDSSQPNISDPILLFRSIPDNNYDTFNGEYYKYMISAAMGAQPSLEDKYEGYQ